MNPSDAIALIISRQDRLEARMDKTDEDRDEDRSELSALRREVALLSRGVDKLTTAVYAAAGSLVVAVVAAYFLAPKVSGG